MTSIILRGGQRLTNVHSAAACSGGPCPIHRPSEHHMRHWPQHWRNDRSILERICPHGIGHPDPDGRLPDGDDGTHGCDGCCAETMSTAMARLPRRQLIDAVVHGVRRTKADPRSLRITPGIRRTLEQGWARRWRRG